MDFIQVTPKPGVTVIQGDCLEVLQSWDGPCINLTITDPAYQSLERHRSKGTTTRLKKSKSSSNQWFTIFKNRQYYELFLFLHKVHLDNTHCYVFCDPETEHIILSGRNPFDPKSAEDGMLKNAPIGGMWRPWPTLNWVKTKRANVYAETSMEPARAADWCTKRGMGYHWRRDSERILFLEKGKRKLLNLGWGGTLYGPGGSKTDYPTQKPYEVIEKLILNSTNPGDTVLDPFAGSGIVGKVALENDRRAILIDLDVSWMLEKTFA